MDCGLNDTGLAEVPGLEPRTTERIRAQGLPRAQRPEIHVIMRILVDSVYTEPVLVRGQKVTRGRQKGTKKVTRDAIESRA